MSWAFDIGFMNGFMGGFYNRYSSYYEPDFYASRCNNFYSPLFYFRPSLDFTKYWYFERSPKCYECDNSVEGSAKEYFNRENYLTRKRYKNTSDFVRKPTQTPHTNTENPPKVSLNKVDGEIDKSKRIFLGRQIKTERGMFGMRMHPVDKVRKMHYGIDLPYTKNEKVYSFTDGTVTHSGWGNGYGNWIEIEDANGVRHRYAHANKLIVKVGQKVKAGELIMLAGSTGKSTGPHVHYETRVKKVDKNGKEKYEAVDPFTTWA